MASQRRSRRAWSREKNTKGRRTRRTETVAKGREAEQRIDETVTVDDGKSSAEMRTLRRKYEEANEG